MKKKKDYHGKKENKKELDTQLSLNFQLYDNSIYNRACIITAHRLTKMKKDLMIQVFKDLRGLLLASALAANS
jgi:hypothetical protein